MKLNKSAVIALALIVVMLGSTFTAGLLQAFSFGVTGNAVQNTENDMSKQLIFYNDLSEDIKFVFLKNGITVIRFSYDSSCTECPDIKNYLEDMTNRANGQIRLVESRSSSATTDLTISNIYEERPVYKLEQNEVLKTLCDLIIEPSSVTGLIGECAQIKV